MGLSNIVVDIGGTKIKIGVIGNPLSVITLRTPQNGETCLNLIAQEALRLKDSETVIVVACPGLITLAGVCENALYVPLRGINIKEEIFKRTGCRTIVDNDANVQALGFCKPNSIYLSIGTGVGGAYINSKGAIERGQNNFSGEFGHLFVGGLDRCYCGRVGCLDTMAAGRVLVDKFGDKWWENDRTPEITEKIIQAGEASGRAIAQLSILYDPQRIYIRGRICEFDAFKNAVMDAAARYGWYKAEIDFNVSTWEGILAGSEKMISGIR